MSQSVSVLLLDDGELDDVQKILEHAKIPFGRVRGASIVEGMRGPTDLLVATPRRIHAVQAVEHGHPDGSAPVRIVVTNGDSNTLRDQLRKVGFDYLVRRPVHPEALRLLILHAIYSGEERRTEPRVSIGCDVTFKCGLMPRTGLLADLSTRGCRLLARRAIDMGRRIKLHIPVALGASEPIVLRGQVVRSRFDENVGAAGLYSVGILFEKMPNSARQELEWIIEERSVGPYSLNEGSEREADEENLMEVRGIREIPAANIRSDPRYEPDFPGSAPPVDSAAEEDKPLASIESTEPAFDASAFVSPSSGESAESSADRRRIRRAAFTAKVPAFGSRALRVLVGRDLSMHGMRVESSPELTVGDRLHLAIYGNPDEEPFLLWATVDRDDGDGSMVIAFDELHSVVAGQLEKLIVSLPSVESLHDREIDAMGTVISERLPIDGE
jgi:hypothetical protein